MLNFRIDESKCIKCGLCAKDCPKSTISFKARSTPYIKPSREETCIKCQHCMAVCPTAALSILGVDPFSCVMPEEAANAEQMNALIRNRRSVRQFKKKNIEPNKLDELIKITANAPTAKNSRTVTINIIDNMADMDIFVDKVINKLKELHKAGKLTGNAELFAVAARAYGLGHDIIFRGAPHLVVTSAPIEGSAPLADGLISLSYMELMASSMGLGAVWLGYLMRIFTLAPELKNELNIPDDHVISYAMLLGEPAVRYHRGVVRDEINVNRVHFSQ